MEMHRKILEDYAKSRSETYREMVCHAPLVNLNFDQSGNARACCYNFKHILGTWPTNSINEIWRGEKANELRKYVRENNLGGGCSECGNMIISGNHQGVRAKHYDEFAKDSLSTRAKYFANKAFGYLSYPKVMEFELSNECNLECVMCNGEFSSSIRKNREKKSPIISPYNDQFVDELEEFIPHLTDAKFLGGEPFMIEIYLKIWERILKINPSIRIHITTNGTFLNNRIKTLLEGLNAGIILSMDSVNKDTYRQIRINGNFDKVMENLAYFQEYAKRKKTFISIAACPITLNWHELPEMLDFCIEKEIILYFNAVFTPQNLSLREQSSEYLSRVIDFLEAYKYPEKTSTITSSTNASIRAYKDFIKLLKGWLTSRKNELKVYQQNVEEVLIIKEEIQNPELLIGQLLHLSYQGYYEKEEEIHQKLSRIVTMADENLLSETLKCYQRFYLLYHKADVSQISNEKSFAFAKIISAHDKRSKILETMCRLPPVELGGFIFNKTEVELNNDLAQFF